MTVGTQCSDVTQAHRNYTLRLPLHRVERAAELPRDVLRAERVRGHGFSDVGEVTEPGGTLVEGVVGLGKGR
jgi:hypothetical protein